MSVIATFRDIPAAPMKPVIDMCPVSSRRWPLSEELYSRINFFGSLGFERDFQVISFSVCLDDRLLLWIAELSTSWRSQIACSFQRCRNHFGGIDCGTYFLLRMGFVLSYMFFGLANTLKRAFIHGRFNVNSMGNADTVFLSYFCHSYCRNQWTVLASVLPGERRRMTMPIAAVMYCPERRG